MVWCWGVPPVKTPILSPKWPWGAGVLVSLRSGVKTGTWAHHPLVRVEPTMPVMTHFQEGVAN